LQRLLKLSLSLPRHIQPAFPAAALVRTALDDEVAEDCLRRAR
jgi:hypothetical protein